MINLKDKSGIICFHCGDKCRNGNISSGEKHFCCTGCKTIYEILYDNELCNYYKIDEKAGVKNTDTEADKKFEFLDDMEIQNKIIEFRDINISSVTFQIPGIHCTSCIWLLEKLYKLDNGIVSSNVDFLKKSVSVIFKNSEVTLKEIVILLSSIGYEPLINLDKSNAKRKLNSSIHRKLILKIGIAGFCLGNIMLLSFPEYLGLDSLADGNLKFIFNYLNILFSLPVIFYCSSDYFKSAWTCLLYTSDAADE